MALKTGGHWIGGAASPLMLTENAPACEQGATAAAQGRLLWVGRTAASRCQNIGMQYFPLDVDRFEHQFGVRALPASASIVEATEHYDEQVSLKRTLLEEDPANYSQSLPGSGAAEREAASLLLASASFLAPPTAALSRDDVLCGEAASSPSPLLSIARHLQEDLAILRGDSADGQRLVAGVVCFPSGWSIADKIGKSILDVHAPVPEYVSVMSRSTDGLLDRLKSGRPVWRMNWGVRPSARLDQSPKHAEELQAEAERIQAENAGQRCYFRVERQTLSRLPETGSILFTIHTHQCPLGELLPWQQRNLLGVLESCPPETLRYKGIAPLKDAVCHFLRQSHAAT